MSSTSAVDSKLKKTTIAENVILGEVRDMTAEEDAILEDAANTTSEQLANRWLTWAKTHQPSASRQPPNNNSQRNCESDSCTSKTWQLSAQTKEMEDSGLCSSILSPFCEDLPV